MLILRDLAKRYGDHTALDGLSLDVGRSEVFGLLGPNGAGKSTTVALSVGLLRPDSGSVDIAGAGPPTDPKVRRRVGLAPQSLAIYEQLTAEENLLFFTQVYGFGGEDAKSRVARGLRFARLEDRRHDRVHTFSGGMKRRLNIAVALVHQPELVLLDEPTVGVDPQSRNAIFESIEALREDGVTVIYTTHYMEEAERLCDRVGVIDKGRLLAVDTVAGLVAEHGGPTTLCVDIADEQRKIETDAPLEELNRLSKTEEVRRFSVQSPTLEDVFLKLTGRSLRD